VCHTSTSVTCALVLEVIEQAGKDIPNPTVVAAIKPSWSPAWKRPNPSLIVAILASGRSSGEAVRREGELAQPGHGQTSTSYFKLYSFLKASSILPWASSTSHSPAFMLSLNGSGMPFSGLGGLFGPGTAHA